MFACDSLMPLGFPVVPEEYMMTQISAGRDVGTAAVRCGRGQHGLVLVAVGALGRELDDVGDTRDPVADLVDTTFEFGADDQQLGTGVVEDVVHLIAGQPEVDDRRSRAQ